MKGRPAKTKAELKANGTYRPAYHANRLEVAPVVEIPPPPAAFDREHKEKWVEVCGLLMDAGILAAADADAVRVYVEATITARRTYAIMQKDGFVLDGRKHPAHMVYAEAIKTMRAIFDQFGFTPRARMGIKTEPKKRESDDPLDQIARMLAGDKKAKA